MFEIIVLILLIAVIVFMGYVIYLMSEQIEQFEDVVEQYTDWIENFVEQERYEDCSFLVEIKKRIENHYIEVYTNNLLKNIKK